ncbi:MAG: hypothetical protein EXX96DRAFT_550784 [Benjaminiella poitrasii]|nr:MAG: hypothetical protein EXX96DRAFT_550784 [Benjaminiella poitrasii]
MDKPLIDYDRNLEELEKQREKLEIVMQMMGQKWKESDLINEVISESTNLNDSKSLLSNVDEEALFLAQRPIFSPSIKTIISQNVPSPEYLQSLLNINEALLAQSLANENRRDTTPSSTNVEINYNNSPVFVKSIGDDDETP